GALAADDDAGTGRRDRDARAIGRALDVDLRDARVIELVLDEAPDLHVLVQQIRVGLRREPARAPAARHAESEADRMCFLAHRLLFLLRLPAALRRRLVSTARRAAPGRAACTRASPAPPPRACPGSGRVPAGPSGPTRGRSGRAPSFAWLSALAGRRRRRLLRATVRPERAGHRKFTEPVAHHVLGHVHGDELLAVVDGDRVADELGRDRRAPGPGLQHLL